MLAACADYPTADLQARKDPFEEGNRAVFAFNLGVDDVVTEPAAAGLRKLPRNIQRSVRSHVEWGSLPSTAVNSVLQGKAENAALASLTFAVNGLTLGLADLMEGDDRPEYEDFGQTLASGGFGEGPYLVVPLLGSQTVRSLTGWGVDLALNPYGRVTAGAPQSVRVASVPVAAVSSRATYFDAINNIKYNSLDPYAKARSAFYQQRDGLLRNNLPAQETDDRFDSFFEN